MLLGNMLNLLISPATGWGICCVWVVDLLFYPLWYVFSSDGMVFEGECASVFVVHFCAYDALSMTLCTLRLWCMCRCYSMGT